LPAEIVERNFLLEVYSVCIPSWVGTDEMRKIAELLAQVNSGIPFAIVAFLPEHRLRHIRSPNFEQMTEALEAAKDAGLKNVKLGNVGRFVKNKEEYEKLFRISAI
jgi:pyruvate formate lyase activating enzyme